MPPLIHTPINAAQHKIQLAQRILPTEDKHLLEEPDLILKPKNQSYELSDEDIEELDQMQKEHKSGKSKSYTVAEVRKYVYGKLEK